MARTRPRCGLTLEEYDQLLSSQGGVCAICKTPPKPGGRRLNVDHDHKTGKVRGLLCHRCNRALPWMSDSSDRLRAAADYLEQYVANTTMRGMK